MSGPERQAVVCHASGDSVFAHELGAFLERNCPVAVSYEPIATDLLDAVEHALGDLVCVVLSRASAPPNFVQTWKREEWEPALIERPLEFGTEMAFLLEEPCRFPELLRRKNFFDCSGSSVAGFRGLKRRLLESRLAGAARPLDLPDARTDAHAPDVLDRLNVKLADRLGLEDALRPEEALEFCRAAALDFEGIFWIHCRVRSRAGVLGDVAQALGLRLPGPAERNFEALSEFCRTRRCLFVFAGIDFADRDLASFGGKSSVILCSYFDSPRRQPQDLMALFAAWPNAVDECAAALGDAEDLLRRIADPEVAAEFGMAIVGLLKHLDRLAEADEILEILSELASRAGDPFRARRLAWERSWIAESWGCPVEGPVADLPGAARPPVQLDLFDAAGAAMG